MKVGINAGGESARRSDSAYWNHHDGSTVKIKFQFPRHSDVVAHSGKGIPGKGPIEVHGTINNQGPYRASEGPAPFISSNRQRLPTLRFWLRLVTVCKLLKDLEAAIGIEPMNK